MTLPRVAARTTTVTFSDGQTVEAHGLRHDQALDVQEVMGDGALSEKEKLRRANPLIVAYGTDTDLAEATEWCRTAPSDAVEALTEAIAALTGQNKEAPKSSAADVPDGST